MSNIIESDDRKLRQRRQKEMEDFQKMIMESVEHIKNIDTKAEEIKAEEIQEVKRNLYHEMSELSVLTEGVRDVAKHFERVDELGTFALLDSLYVAMKKRLDTLHELITSMPGESFPERTHQEGCHE